MDLRIEMQRATTFASQLAYVLESYLISGGVLKRYKVLNVGKLRYLAIVVESEDAYETSKVIELLQWLEAIGVKRVCLYDTEGVLKKSKEVILTKLKNATVFEEGYKDESFVDQKRMSLEFSSFSDGKEAITKAANLLFVKYLKLATLPGHHEEKIFTEPHMDDALRAIGRRGPDPDLLLVYGPARCHLGFPAWRMRYTEIVHMGQLKHMRYGSLIKAIYKFTTVRQNYVYGVEYAFGAHEYSSSGVFEVEPRQCPGFKFRRSIFIGTACLDPFQVREFMESESANYNGDTYHLIIKNCNHFCHDICYKLTGKSTPKWVNRLAKIGSMCNCILPDALKSTTVPHDPNFQEYESEKKRLRSAFTCLSSISIPQKEVSMSSLFLHSHYKGCLPPWEFRRSRNGSLKKG